MQDTVLNLSRVAIDSVHNSINLDSSTLLSISKALKSEQFWLPILSPIVPIIAVIITAIISFRLNKKTLKNANELFEKQTAYNTFIQWSNDLRKYSAIFLSSLSKYSTDLSEYSSNNLEVSNDNQDAIEKRRAAYTHKHFDSEAFEKSLHIDPIKQKQIDKDLSQNLRESDDQLTNAEYNLLLLLDEDGKDLKELIQRVGKSRFAIRYPFTPDQNSKYLEEYALKLNELISLRYAKSSLI